ncbi:Transposase C of IS166 homeodomain protein [Roseovarius gaetbuli]|uniref:Transposase C of IS166 homeodomain protein n=1 Tax=Roseovarius gaetbuli TaxID=1356575 RepID=A0A1X7A656_9RHOB|nr:hypothetical protein [Roseovarius gaetbuli]SLN71129.1 Transposase C of IS166 homeodomain protein [Roseovarius gaetbuli]
MLDVSKSLPEDPDELRQFTSLLLAEVKSQAVLIEKLRHQLAGHRNHRFGSSSESIEQLQLALETSEIAVAKMTAKLRLPPLAPTVTVKQEASSEAVSWRVTLAIPSHKATHLSRGQPKSESPPSASAIP